MITVPQKVEEIVKNSAFLEDALANNLINTSELARQIQPQIQDKLVKDVTVGSIVMALKRLAKELPNRHIESEARRILGEITIRSNLVEFTFRNSDSLLERLKKLLEITPTEVFLTWTRGIHETTIIIGLTMGPKVLKLFQNESMCVQIDNLSSLTIKLSKNNLSSAGLYYYVLKLLAWEGIVITEIVSTATELTIIMEEKYIQKAFSVIKQGAKF